MSQSVASNHQSLRRIIRYLHKIEDTTLLLMLLSMVGFSILQIVLRNGFDSGIHWLETAMRMQVIWIAMLGAMRASRENEHISIKLLQANIHTRHVKLITFSIGIFCSLVCAITAYYCLLFVLMEREDGSIAFAQIPFWWCETILPFAFIIMAVRFLTHYSMPLLSIRETKQESKRESNEASHDG